MTTAAPAGPAPAWDVKFVTQAEIDTIWRFAWNPHRDSEVAALVYQVDGIVAAHCAERDALLADLKTALTQGGQRPSDRCRAALLALEKAGEP